MNYFKVTRFFTESTILSGLKGFCQAVTEMAWMIFEILHQICPKGIFTLRSIVVEFLFKIHFQAA